jgi:chemotaxis protein methyltransferase CheR
MPTPEQFDRTRRLALNLAGIELAERHRELLLRRSRRLGVHDAAGFDALLGAAEQGEAKAAQQFLRLLTTKFTGFFRHPQHFDLAAKHALEAVRHRGQARLWSAAAATGEEPWSLAMTMVESFHRSDPPVQILATDVDAEALAVAQRGEYDEAALHAVSLTRRDIFFNESTVARRWSVAPALRGLVKFRELNLTSVAWPVDGLFDVIFCRNVLMYFEAGHRYAVLERMASLLAPEGLLMLDPAEHLGNAAHWFTPGVDGVYSRRRGLPESRRVARVLQPVH